MATTTSMASSYTIIRSSITPLLALLSVVIFAVSKVAGEPPSVVRSACKRAYTVGGGSFTENFCLSALTGHSVGAADNADLALFAVNLATANATATEAKIDAELANGGGGGGALAEGLRSCRALYDAVVRQYQPECRAAVKHARYGDAKQCLRRTAEAPAECERAFEQRTVASPVTREDDNLAKLANLAIALATIS